MKLVIIESPYAGDVKRNELYLDYCIRDCLTQKEPEAPFASHRMYTSALNDLKATDRKLGIDAGLAWRRAAGERIFYVDLDWSGGMNSAHELYELEGLSYQRRVLSIDAFELFQEELETL